MKSPTRTMLTRMLATVLIFWTTLTTAAEYEYIVLSGGPALRRWEDLRRAGEQHDRWWGNFVATAMARVKDIRQQQPGMPITWLVYRDAYVRRGAEDGKPYAAWAAEKQAKYGIKIVWISNGDDVVRYINKGQSRRRTKVAGFEYFGHSNKHCFMFDYSSEIYGASCAWLHENDLQKINSGAFAKNAFCKSWGCHTAESMSAFWKKATGIGMIGANGKTDYSDLHLRNNSPGLSSGAHWKTRG